MAISRPKIVIVIIQPSKIRQKAYYKAYDDDLNTSCHLLSLFSQLFFNLIPRPLSISKVFSSSTELQKNVAQPGFGFKSLERMPRLWWPFGPNVSLWGLSQLLLCADKMTQGRQ